MYSIYIFIILIILLAIYYIFNMFYNYKENISNKTEFHPENMVIIERPLENIKLIDTVFREKPYLFDKNKIDILKKKFQVFNSKEGLENISDIFYNKTNNIKIKNSNKNEDVLEHLYTEPIYDKNHTELYSEANKKIKFGLDAKLNNYYYDVDGCKKQIM